MKSVAMADRSICIGASAWTDVAISRGGYHFNCLYPENRYKQHMQQPIKRIASDPQCLKLVTDVCKQQSTDLSPGTSSAFFSMGCTCICCKLLKHIGHNIACFAIYLADRFTRIFRCCVRSLWCCQSSHKTSFCNVLERQPPAAIMSSGPSV